MGLVKSDSRIGAPLSELEVDTLRLYAKGRTRGQIGVLQKRSVNTVNHALQMVFWKLGINNKALAVLEAQRLGLL